MKQESPRQSMLRNECCDEKLLAGNERWAKLDAFDLLVTEINSEYYKFVSAEDAEQNKFDDETRHGVDSDKEAEWEKKYDVH